MKNGKIILTTVILLLVTAGLIAGKVRYVTTGPLYASNALVPTTLNSYQLTPAVFNLIDLTTLATGIQVKVTDINGAIYNLYINISGTTLTPVYSTESW